MAAPTDALAHTRQAAPRSFGLVPYHGGLLRVLATPWVVVLCAWGGCSTVTAPQARGSHSVSGVGRGRHSGLRAENTHHGSTGSGSKGRSIAVYPTVAVSVAPLYREDWRVRPGRRICASPARMLAAAVLERAVLDLRAAARWERSGAAARMTREARTWFTEEGGTWPYRFEALCHVLELDPGRVRRQLGLT